MSVRQSMWDTLSVVLSLAAAALVVFALQKRPAAGAPPRGVVPQPAKPGGERPPLQWRLTLPC
jgi:hypothetical protein